MGLDGERFDRTRRDVHITQILETSVPAVHTSVDKAVGNSTGRVRLTNNCSVRLIVVLSLDDASTYDTSLKNDRFLVWELWSTKTWRQERQSWRSIRGPVRRSRYCSSHNLRAVVTQNNFPLAQ